MKTASFFTYKGPGRISIARFPPRGTPKGFRVYKRLAPGQWFNSVSRQEYEERFAAQLAELDAVEVKAELEAMAGEHEPVLLCYERPPFHDTNFCHRRLVANWLLETVGLHVTELISREMLEAAVLEHLPAEEQAMPLFALTETELIEKLPRDVLEGFGLL